MDAERIPKCKCGGKARYREKGEYCWIECRKCSKRTGYYPRPTYDVKDAFVGLIQEWNRMIKS